MRSGRQYLVCLKLFRKPEGYRYSEREKRTFLLTDPNSSQFRTDREIQNYVPQGETKITFQNLAQYDCMMNEQDFSKYVFLYEEMVKFLK